MFLIIKLSLSHSVFNNKFVQYTSAMNRSQSIQTIESDIIWDIIIIGGGATGLGAALDAASRGYKTLLLEKFDFAKGTSSRATKLVHGGVRYLGQGNIKLVFEALRERGRLLSNAPHITSTQAFILPVYSWWQKIFYVTGLRIYDLLAANLSLGKTKILNKAQTMQALPAINADKLAGGILYFDGQFDDSRLAIDIASTAYRYGACLLNYVSVEGFEKKENKITAVIANDVITGKQYNIKGKAFINATGVFAESIMQKDMEVLPISIAPSQGIHLVINKKYFSGTHALMIPKTDDGRVLFAVPWHDEVIVGTTDTPVDDIHFEPKALEEEIDFIIHHFNKYCNASINRSDVLSVYAGLRPLVKSNKAGSHTALLSRDHHIVVSPAGLVNIVGGKWTTYRKMAQDAIDNAIFTSTLTSKKCITKTLPIGEWDWPIDKSNPLHLYGLNAKTIDQWMQEDESMCEKIHPLFKHTRAEVIWFIRNEMAITIEDVLARRTRLLLLNARAAIESANKIAKWMAAEMGKDHNWEQEQIKAFTTLAQQYIL